jgi:signal transduction histidine kinase
MVTAVRPVRPASLLRVRPESGARALPAAACAVLTACVVAGTLAADPQDERALAAVVFGLVAGVPMAVGLVAWRLHPQDRFARLLFGAGAMSCLTALSQSSDSVLYSVGRVSVWIAVAMLQHLMLTFPSGRLTARSDRRLMAVVWGLAGGLYVPTALIVQHFPEPSPWALCDAACPANAFALVHFGQSFVDDFVQPVREILTVLVGFAVAVALARRVRRSGPMGRRATVPVLAVAVLQAAAFVIYLWSRRSGAVPATVDALGWLWVLTLPAVALSFGFGLLARRLYAAAALQRLALRLQAPVGAAELRAGLAEALEDPSLRVVYWLDGDPGRWVDDSGWPTTAPEHEQRRAYTEVAADGGRRAAVIHDPALAPDAAFISAAAAYGLMVLENTRLIGELRSSLERLSDSEIRGAAAARGERERIKRDLHDGAQQRLVSVRFKLARIADRIDHDAPIRAGEVAALAGQVDQTIDEVRSLAHDPYPGVLAQEGIADALRAAVAHTPIETRVEADGVGRFEPNVEATAYFACMEAVQNAVKHAQGATRIVVVLLDAGRRLTFEVRDDGAGFPDNPATHGAGLANITDRLTSVGGRLTIASSRGQGTRVIGTIPIM